MLQQLILALWAIVLAIGLSALFFIGSNLLLDRVLTSDHLRDDDARSQRDDIRESIRPWIFIGPALLLLALYLVVPVFYTLWLSLNSRGEFVGFANYLWAFNNRGFQISVRNNLLWLFVVPTFSTIFGLLIAYLTDRMWWRNIARSLIFLPMAISFVGASVIWRFIYDYRGPGDDQIGLLNAVVVALGGDPQAWIALQPLNNFLLMAIMVWIQTGFAMVLLGAAIRGVPEDTIEAANMDGANEIQMLFKIVIPQVWGTIVVVWTTITVLVLKIFDVVLAMTNGQWQTQVLANLMFDIMFRAGDFGRGSTVAVFIMLAVLPIMWWNVRQARKEMG
ncbi:sugar ABC transporter permease [Natronospirillum operosum]|uniref:Sugar ABC transporter permease n=1 Tax=Natronospirillum operosum TaxID=2759953 RepID=A0A4Z0WCF0_9GAMM|nr:sugar ABC transporter permease [Natronospirillum operosum]TGG91345.1 sugar ABC transporter permease [Natronospirillum operosum]